MSTSLRIASLDKDRWRRTRISASNAARGRNSPTHCQMSHQWRSSTAAGQPQRHHPQLEPSSRQMARGSRHKSAALGVTFCSTSRSRQSRWCGRRKATVIPARLRAARDPCRMTGLLSMRAMLPRHENRLKAADKPFGERTADVRYVALPGFHG